MPILGSDMSKGSKRQSWRTQRNVYKAIGRELAALAAENKPLVYTCALPPPKPIFRREKLAAERATEKERLRSIVRETLAAELAERAPACT